ncbi:MAG: hypothetical protein ABII76_16950 [Pseudomonadota bacterium]
MKVRLTIDEVDGCWEIEVPTNVREFAEGHRRQSESSPYASVAAFENMLAIEFGARLNAEVISDDDARNMHDRTATAPVLPVA